MIKTCRVRRLAALVTGATVAVAVLAGCAGDGDAGSAPVSVSPPAAPTFVPFTDTAAGSGAGKRLGLVLADGAVPINNQISQGIQQQAKKAGADLTVCDARGQASGALDCVKQFKTLNLDGYFLYQLNTAASASICAAGPDVPVIGISFDQKPCQKANLGVDNSYAGYQAGRAVGEYAKKNFDCKYDAYVSLELSALGAANTDRMNGYRTGVASVCGKLHDEKVLDVASPDAARTKFRDVLTSTPGADHILVVGVADYAVLGAQSAAKNSNREDDVYFSGQAADPSALCQIATNKNWIADTAYFPEKWGQAAVPAMLNLLKGATVSPELTTESVVVTSANIEKYYSTSSCS